MQFRSKTLLPLCCLTIAVTAISQERSKPWTDWSKVDADRVLTDSPWGQSFRPSIPYDPSSEFAYPGSEIKVCFFSAMPIRQALVRQAEIDPRKYTNARLETLRKIVNSRFDQNIVILMVGGTRQDANTNFLKYSTYLECDGKRVYLEEYQVKSEDGLGTKFIFPRFINGAPLLDLKSKEVRFHSEFPKWPQDTWRLVIDLRFKVKDMIYNGALEY